MNSSDTSSGTSSIFNFDDEDNTKSTDVMDLLKLGNMDEKEDVHEDRSEMDRSENKDGQKMNKRIMRPKSTCSLMSNQSGTSEFNISSYGGSPSTSRPCPSIISSVSRPPVTSSVPRSSTDDENDDTLSNRKRRAIIMNIARGIAESGRVDEEFKQKCLDAVIMIPIVLIIASILFFVLFYFSKINLMSDVMLIMSGFVVIIIIIIISLITYYYTRNFIENDIGYSQEEERFRQMMNLLQELFPERDSDV